MSYNILAINPGSTSTKVALYDSERPLLELTLRHTTEETSRFATIADQLDWRRSLILDALREQQFDIHNLAVVIGRGGMLKPIASGVYEVTEAMKHDLHNAHEEHASNLGGLLAAEIAATAGVKAYIADPVVVDELDDIARISGLPQCPRRSVFHALNQKATARLHCDREGLIYEQANLIVAHLGGGISVGAHRAGRIVDVNNALDGDGPIAPERAGTLPAVALADLCFSGEYTRAQIQKLLAGKGGMLAHLGINSVQEAIGLGKAGDEKAQQLVDAICYTVSKQIGAMATVLCGKVDGIVLTGGIVYNEYVVKAVTQRCEFIAPITVYPGENEMEALASNALAILKGLFAPKVYA